MAKERLLRAIDLAVAHGHECGSPDPQTQVLELIQDETCTPDLVAFAVSQRTQNASAVEPIDGGKDTAPRSVDDRQRVVGGQNRSGGQPGKQLCRSAAGARLDHRAPLRENLTSGAKSIALAELGSKDKRRATEIGGNAAAMVAALALADRLDEQAILAMHAALLWDVQPEIAGRWRAEQVWIGGDSFEPNGAAFIPPHPDQVPALMADLVKFTRRADRPLLSQAAIADAQFETIHPFPDGNGRTGRALIHAMLRAHRLTRNVTVPVSAGLLTDTNGYFDALTAYREGDPAPIVERLANASFAAAANGRQLVLDLREVRQGWQDTIKARRGATA